jgi:hypothetical protein
MTDTIALDAGRYILSPVEFDVVWSRLQLGPAPVVLNLPSPGRTHTERRGIEAEGWAALRHRGLAGPSGPEPGLERLLRRLAGPSRRLELRAWWPGTLRVVAAAHGEEGVLARRCNDTVMVEPCTSLPAAVVGVLPPGTAGPGRAANMPTSEFVAALGRPSGAGLRADLVDHGVDPDEAGLAARMLDGIERRAQLVALIADGWGLPRRSTEALGILEGPRGRYLTTNCQADDGTDWTTLAPTDDRRLRNRVADLLTATAQAVRPQSRSPWRMSCRPDSVIEPDREG